ncbi:MAG: hypothetical protein WAL15_19540 [Xanthobacteraceae bacterium]
MKDKQLSPAEATRKLRRFGQQLREYVEGTADELTPFIERDLATYVADAIEQTGREQIGLERALGLIHNRPGAPSKREQSKDLDAYKRQQELIYRANQERANGKTWKQIVGIERFRGSERQLEKLCREQSDYAEQFRRKLANRPRAGRRK